MYTDALQRYSILAWDSLQLVLLGIDGSDLYLGEPDHATAEIEGSVGTRGGVLLSSIPSLILDLPATSMIKLGGFAAR